jgi:hypothetical protein
MNRFWVGQTKHANRHEKWPQFLNRETVCRMNHNLKQHRATSRSSCIPMWLPRPGIQTLLHQQQLRLLLFSVVALGWSNQTAQDPVRRQSGKQSTKEADCSTDEQTILEQAAYSWKSSRFVIRVYTSRNMKCELQRLICVLTTYWVKILNSLNQWPLKNLKHLLSGQTETSSRNISVETTNRKNKKEDKTNQFSRANWEHTLASSMRTIAIYGCGYSGRLRDFTSVERDLKRPLLM